MASQNYADQAERSAWIGFKVILEDDGHTIAGSDNLIPAEGAGKPDKTSRAKDSAGRSVDVALVYLTSVLESS